MCKRKPGPRCSADTRRNLSKAHERYSATRSKLMAAAEAKRPNVAILDAQFQEARKNYKVATYEYYSTPEGLKRLDEYISREPLNPDTPIEFDEGFVSGSMTAEELRIVKEGAVNHREWQANTLSALEKMNPKQAVGYADLMRSSLEKKITESNARIAELEQAEASLMVTNQAVATARQVIRNSILRARVQQTYDTIQVDDLAQFTPEEKAKKGEPAPAKTGVQKWIPVAVRDLKPGDEIGNGRILKVTAGIKTTKGKKEVTYQDHAGNVLTREWGAGTQVQVLANEV